MREHLYKAKRVNWRELPKGEWWVEGNYVFSSTKAYIILDVETDCIDGENTDLYAIEWYEVIKETVCEYIGLPDKKGRKIFDDDIAKCKKHECYGHIWWNKSKARFCFLVLQDRTFEEKNLYDYLDDLEVIGNIFDDVNLLKEGKP